MMQRWIGLLLGVLFVFSGGMLAQSDAPQIALVEEHDIGFRCPVAALIEPETTVLWVLMNSCFSANYSLHAYDLFTREPLREPLALPEIDGDRYFVEGYFANPLAFSASGDLLVTASDVDTYYLTTFTVDLETGSVTTDAQADSALNALLSQFGEYLELTFFSHDRAYALAFDEGGTDVVDLADESLLFTVEGQAVGTAFSADNQRLYVSLLDEPDNYENYDTTLNTYSLPGGELINSLPLRVSGVYPSPDERYLVYQPNDGEMSVIDLETGISSPTITIDEGQSRVLTCLNTGSDVSDVDFTRDGRFPIMGLQWLPDSTGFITANTYGGDGAGGGVGCIFDYSRLRVYSLSGG